MTQEFPIMSPGSDESQLLTFVSLATPCMGHLPTSTLLVALDHLLTPWIRGGTMDFANLS